MSKEVIMVFIIGFWLIFPLPMMFLNIGGFEEIDYGSLESTSKPTLLNYLGLGIDLLGMYFFTIFIWVIDAPLFLNIFFIFLRLISGFMLVLILRGI